MSAAQRHPQGPLRFATLVKFTVDDEVALFWDKTRMDKVQSSDDDQDFIVRDFDRSDMLSTTQLATTRTAHLIMDRNETENEEMRLWPNDFYPGRRIQIPTIDSLRNRNYF